MPRRPRIDPRTGLAGVAAVALALLGGWSYQHRDTIAAACLGTINGVTTKLAHLNEPFGAGTNVNSSNPVLGIVPDFTLQGSDGGVVRKSDLLGSYWVASFIFTRCATTCPMAVTELAGLQEDLPETVKLVSISVDPEHDSPEVLAEYAKRVGADVERWHFLTGEKSAIYAYVREGFHLAVQETPEAPAGWEVMHTPRFALVDPRGRIRGFYDSNDSGDVDRLRRDVDRLLGVAEENNT